MSESKRVLVTKRVFPEAIEFLRSRCEVDYVETDDGLPTEELLGRSRGCAAIISQLTDRLDAVVLRKLDDSVRIIANVAVGYDNIDVQAATARGILVTNTPDVLTETTADFAFALLMAAARRVVEAHGFVHSGEWKRWAIDLLVGHDIHHRTLGLFGLGRIGAAVARRGRGFAMRILYCDDRPAMTELEQELEAVRVSKEELLRRADFVSLHVPLTASTRHMIGAAELAMMKRAAVLVNTARGAVVDEEALAEALARGRIAAAGLDVFEAEPKIHPRLLGLPNVVLASHIASASVDTRRRMSLMAAENVVAALSGARPVNLVNPQSWPEPG
jgi:glyoxylate reductase